MIEHVECASLAEVYELAQKRIGPDGGQPVLNFSLGAIIPVQGFDEPSFLDVVEAARDWQSVQCPNRLHFSHGQFIGEDGISNLIDELKKKPTSNRALVSLISQKHIVGAGDHPIPSFMILQSAVEKDWIYITVYFRALEISSFLRVNLEEIRMIGERIRDEFRQCKSFVLTIFAFRAYVKSDIDLLSKARIDTVSVLELIDLMRDAPLEFIEMIDAKADYTTVPNSSGLQKLLDISQHPKISSKTSFNLELPRLTAALTEAIDFTERLADLRRRYSHHQDVDSMASELSRKMKALAQLFKECRFDAGGV